MRNLFLALAAAVVALGAQTAAAQDQAPPGCRWQHFQGDQVLACKDGKGYWRRSGDGEIVGRYAVAKPKPKPAAAPSSVARAEPAPPPPPPPPPPSQGDAFTTPPSQAQAAPPAKSAPPQAVLPSGSEPPEPPKPWWRKLLDGFWDGVLDLLRLVGLLH